MSGIGTQLRCNERPGDLPLGGERCDDSSRHRPRSKVTAKGGKRRGNGQHGQRAEARQTRELNRLNREERLLAKAIRGQLTVSEPVQQALEARRLEAKRARRKRAKAAKKS